MVAFLVLLYAVYMLALVLDGILLRTGVFNGANPAGLTIVPAALAGAAIAIFLLIALIPEAIERRLGGFAAVPVRAHAQRLASGPADPGDRHAHGDRFVRDPSRGGLAVLGAVGFWAANIGILWAAFHAYDARSRSGSSCRDSSSAWSPT